MTYTLNVVNHTPITIQNGAVDNTTSLTLVGKNYPNYGQLIQQDLINLLQSWAGTTPPASAVTGQLWYNTNVNSLQIYTGSTFKNVGSTTVSTTAPTANAVQGDLWFKSDDQQVYVYNGTGWLLLGPLYTSTQGSTIAVAMSVVDNLSATHSVLGFFVGNTLTGLLSKDPSFTPITGTTADGKTITNFSGLSPINPGYNINTNVFTGSVPLSGTLVTNAQPYITSVGTLTSLTVSGPITPTTNGTIAIGASGASFGSMYINTINLSGSMVPTTNGSINLGTSSYKFGTIYGTSNTALYADLAENYESDQVYEAGTVVEFGGEKEITLSTTNGATNVAGVISTKPAYLMNDNENPNNLPVALQGRVPCKVHGPVNKGDLLVSAGDGCAIRHPDPKVGSVIGKALQEISDLGVSVIEIVVGVR